jgi:hypothetical protein
LRDLPAIYDVVCALGKDRNLSFEFLAFMWLWEWRGSRRSGIWQYYEGIAREDFEKISSALDHFGIATLAQRYRHGMNVWEDEDESEALTQWMYDHNEEIEDATFNLIVAQKHQLYES